MEKFPANIRIALYVFLFLAVVAFLYSLVKTDSGIREASVVPGEELER